WLVARAAGEWNRSCAVGSCESARTHHSGRGLRLHRRNRGAARWCRRREVRVASVTCCLGPDCAGTVLSGRLAAARSRLDVAVYELGPYYLPPLLAARSHGVPVRVLLDHHPGANSGALPLLARAGIGCRLLGSSKPGDEATGSCCRSTAPS